MNICVIPARGGSKRIPRKNIKAFNGKPIIAYSIEAALESNCFDQVIVSTDDNEIAEVAKTYGAKVPFIRPAELSNDYAGTIPVIKHTIEWLEDHNNTIDNVCCLYATAPFIQSQTISKAFQQLQELKADYCFSVTSFAFPIQRSIRITQDDKVSMFYPENFNVRSQDLEEAYHDAGQFYWGKTQAFKDELPIFSETASPYILPRYLVQDIDTTEDWIRAEVMYRVLQETGLLS
ncbi:N-Acetylneuraminate cytidylyltransferase [Bathymodiolus heckerae thiotrophic gill symbiont]|uniref:pseudaminic acid cytidylyltransferase n=1 Tax=Bathymodiolus heckerae thiotrophic gill symbiont TaxID=1052212 RepID=UPI0010BB3B6B|nr:pseudaminic acid cytidylyltransferase [Bathymodiolus heckerae thiotrophic gill symbiont]SHN89657.1 N-Acetylneuraminate cytidylyltransferase [Bathymodiolus heckerae thiotrophic gill symbiont]